MKFGKSLSNQIVETLPEWKDKFLSYKDLKKQLKLIGDRPEKRRRFDSGADKAEIVFLQLLEDELEKFNSFFVEKEEEYIIRLKDLQDRVAKANNCSAELIKIRKEIVDFHGEMVLLENYSALNYTGLVKILKKYDKRTGALIRLPFIQRVLQQPFFTTDLLFKLVKGCEKMLDRFFPVNKNVDDQEVAEKGGLLGGEKEIAETGYTDSLHMKSTISALRVLKEIRSQSSTVSAFSLPPLQTVGLEDAWKKAPVFEQVAK